MREQDVQVLAGIESAQRKRDQRVAAYTVVEHFSLRNSHFKESAELAAKVAYTKDAGKKYQVLWRKGPEVLHRRVISRILAEDANLSRASERSHLLLVSANYAMKLQGTRYLRGEQCYAVSLRPRVHKFSLIEGQAWFRVSDFSLLRIEGRPATSPSFWTGRPQIQREYLILNGLSFPQHSHATSSGFFAGRSELDIEYKDYSLTQ